MAIKEIIKSQYGASLQMLKSAIVQCPDSLWNAGAYRNRFWHVAWHTLFYTHLYLQPTQTDFVPREKHREAYMSLKSNPQADEWPSKDEVLEYLAFCLNEVAEKTDALNPEAESGFHWLPFNKTELQFYNLRHIQHHTGELCERLGATGEIEIDWVGRS